MAVQYPPPSRSARPRPRSACRSPTHDVQSFIGLIKPNVDAYNVVDRMPDYLPPVKYPRTPGYFPAPEENKHNAWYVKTSIKGARSGPLKGKKVAIKDNIMVAGVPMMNGYSILEGYVPDIDATVVARLLDAGAEIVGKTHCESYCISGGSHTGAKGPVHNPYKMGYSAGGSSSGSGVVVALGEADMALGGDQGGSIRMPSCWCGIYGMKPTHGLVPYTGIMPIEIFVDHTGPMTATVTDNALMLEVIAGPDGYDPRQYAPKVAEVHADARRRREGHEDRAGEGRLRPAGIGGGGRREGADSGAELFKKLGATVDEVSIPDAPARPGDLDADRRRGHRADHDVRRRLRPVAAGPVRHQPDRQAARLAAARQRAVRDDQVLTTLGVYIKKYSRQPLLRQGDEHHAPADRSLRRRAEASTTCC